MRSDKRLLKSWTNPGALGLAAALSRQIDPRVRWVAEWLQNSDLAKPVTIEELARSVHMSPSHLRHMFRHEIGITPARFLKLLRLQRASELVQSTFLEVKEVATAAGFGDLSHFLRDYKAVYEETPSETRLHRKAG